MALTGTAEGGFRAPQPLKEREREAQLAQRTVTGAVQLPMAPPLRVADLPAKPQNEIIAGTLREEIAEFEHLQGIRPRPSSA